jgi:hypothetical protein
MVGRDRRARRNGRNAKSYRMNRRVGCTRKTKFSLLQFVACRAARMRSAIQTLRAGSSTQSNSEIKTTIGTGI